MTWWPFRTAWVCSANQITCLYNKEIQNKNKRPQWLLFEGGPLKYNRFREKWFFIFIIFHKGLMINHSEKEQKEVWFIQRVHLLNIGSDSVRWFVKTFCWMHHWIFIAIMLPQDNEFDPHTVFYCVCIWIQMQMQTC